MYSHEFGRMLDGHIDPEVISDLVGGLLTREQAASLERHFITCAECRDMRDSLAQVRQLLGRLPIEPIPAAVADRIDHALAAEARRRDAADERLTGEAPSGRPAGRLGGRPGRRQGHRAVPSLAEARERRVQRLPAMARVAAAVAVVVTGGVLGFAIVDGIRSGTPNTTAASHAPREEKSLSTNDSGQPPTFAFEQRPYTKAGLANEVRALLAAGRAPASAQGAAPQAPRPGVAADKLAEGAALRPCVLAATGRPQVSPIAVDLGTYQGKPAAVVVLPDAKDPARVDVYVVDSTCTAGKGRVLESRQLPRP